MKKILKILLLVTIVVALFLIINCSGLLNSSKLGNLESRVDPMKSRVDQMGNQLDEIEDLLTEENTPVVTVDSTAVKASFSDEGRDKKHTESAVSSQQTTADSDYKQLGELGLAWVQIEVIKNRQSNRGNAKLQARANRLLKLYDEIRRKQFPSTNGMAVLSDEQRNAIHYISAALERGQGRMLYNKYRSDSLGDLYEKFKQSTKNV